MLPGVTSPCIQPAACSASSASAVCRAIQSASGTPNCCPSANRAASDAPSSQGMTTSRGGSSTEAARIGTKCGCEMLCPTRASRCNRRIARSIVLPARAEHFHRVGGRPIGRRLRRVAPGRCGQGFPIRQTRPTPTVLPDREALPRSQRTRPSGRRPISARSGSFYILVRTRSVRTTFRV